MRETSVVTAVVVSGLAVLMVGCASADTAAPLSTPSSATSSTPYPAPMTAPQAIPTTPAASRNVQPMAISTDVAGVDLCTWMEHALEVARGAGTRPYLSIRERSINEPLTTYEIGYPAGETKVKKGGGADIDRPAGAAAYTSAECDYTLNMSRGAIGMNVKLVQGEWMQPSDEFLAENPDLVFTWQGFQGYRPSESTLKVRLAEDAWLSYEVPSQLQDSWGLEAAKSNFDNAISPLAVAMLGGWDADRGGLYPEVGYQG